MIEALREAGQTFDYNSLITMTGAKPKCQMFSIDNPGTPLKDEELVEMIEKAEMKVIFLDAQLSSGRG